MDNELYEKKRTRKWKHMTPEEKHQELEMLMNDSHASLIPLLLLHHKLKQII